ncbi:MAG: hypothetical protein HY336_01520 [Candidatus Doudnabacteria bacterium]|nr:hypothetical protein [Candidatus Doudnabacteria bacterium]
MPFPFSKIFRQALGLTQTNRFLWPYGLLLFSVVVYPWAKPGLVAAIAALIDKRETDFAKSFKAGSFFVGRITLLAFFAAIFLWLVYIWSVVAFVPVFVFVSSLLELSLLFVVLHDMKAPDSFSSALTLWAKHWPILIILSIILFLISALFPAIAAVVFFQFYGSIGMAFVALFFLLLASLPLVFTQICWVLAFQELVKPLKLEEEQAAILPEVAS